MRQSPPLIQAINVMIKTLTRSLGEFTDTLEQKELMIGDLVEDGQIMKENVWNGMSYHLWKG